MICRCRRLTFLIQLQPATLYGNESVFGSPVIRTRSNGTWNERAMTSAVRSDVAIVRSQASGGGRGMLGGPRNPIAFNGIPCHSINRIELCVELSPCCRQ